MKSAARSAIRSEKVVILGASQTGKTSIVQRILTNRFQGETEATVGASFFSKTVSVDNKTIKLDIWDTGGQERYRSLAPMYYRDARAAVIVFDVTNPESLDEAADWLREFTSQCSSETVLFGAANKIDLVSERKIDAETIKEFQFRHQLEMVHETSALSGVGIKELFDSVARGLLELTPLTSENSLGDISVQEDTVATEQGGCSC